MRFFKFTLIFGFILAITLPHAANAATNDTVKVMMEGKQLKLGYPSRLINGGVYVPLDVIRATGAKIDVDQKHRYDGQSIRVFPAIEKEFNCHAKLVDDQLMLPIWEIAPKLGVEPQWDESTHTLKLLAKIDRLEFDGSEIRAVTSFPVDYDVIWWKGAKKLIVDLHGVQVPEKMPDSAVKNTTSIPMRTGMLDDGETGRIVLEMPANVSYRKTALAKTTKVSVAVLGIQQDTQTPQALPDPITQPDTNEGTQPEPKPEMKTVNITGVECRKIDARHIEVRVSSSSPVNCTSSMVRSPNRLVIDIPNSCLDHNIPDIQVGHGALEEIRTVQRDASTVRVTMDLTRFVLFTISKGATSGDLIINLQLPNGAGGTIARKVIVIDAGHGGRETGAIGCCGTLEKDVTLAIAKRVRKILADEDACALLTREQDTSLVSSGIALDLVERVDYAARHSADIFLSIHCNSCMVPNSMSGTETYYHGQDPSSRELAACVHKQVVLADGLPDRRVKSDTSLYKSGLSVLRNSTAKYHLPAALIEIGFINNANEEAKLIDPDFQQKIAEAIVQGLKNYVEGDDL